MSAAATRFSHVLDQKLAGEFARSRNSHPAPAFGTAPFLPLPGHFQLFERPAGYRPHAFDTGPADRRLDDTRPPSAAPRGPLPGRGLRVQTAEQRRALETLRRLGAELSRSELSELDLKRAFRALARRYHPDRHPGASADDRQALARRFAEVSSAYAILMRPR